MLKPLHLPPIISLNEEELILLLQRQEREAFDYLYRHYAAAISTLIFKIVKDKQTTEDVLQETFVKIWKNILHYDASKGRLFTWMINIARNTAIDRTRLKGEVMQRKIYNDTNNVNIGAENTGKEIMTDAIGLKNLIAGMKEEHRAVIDLTYFNGYTMEETAKALELPVGTVKTRLRSAIKVLRSYFNP